MRTSAVRHPAARNFLTIHHWQLDYCEGDHTTAALLAYFEAWHNTNLAQLEQHQNFTAYLKKTGQKVNRPEPDLYIPRTEHQLIDGIFNACKSPATLRKSIKYLENKGVITSHHNPFGGRTRMRFFLFHPDVLNRWIDEHYPTEPEPQTPSQPTPAQRQNTLNQHVPVSSFEKVTQSNSSIEKLTQSNQAEEKRCSKCGSPMTLRQNKAGQNFWGCTHYPKCDHTESITRPPDKPKARSPEPVKPDKPDKQAKPNTPATRPPPEFTHVLQALRKTGKGDLQAFLGKG